MPLKTVARAGDAFTRRAAQQGCGSPPPRSSSPSHGNIHAALRLLERSGHTQTPKLGATPRISAKLAVIRD
jgi:hypothetical protein